MFRSKNLVILLLLAFNVVFSFAQQKKAMVDYKADLSIIKDKGAYVELIGNVVFYHNGVFITCDTAYRYSEQRMEGIGNVIINSDSTFIYGDKFIYNGETNVAQVFSPLIKTVDKDAVLYTHNMEFNTLENTGTYYNGGTSLQGGKNLMESDKGVYYSKTRSMLLTGEVEMRNENYEITSDTVSYDFNTEVVTFLTLTNIWNHKGEFLIANRGNYNTKEEIYDFYNDAYIMTPERELWADSIVYKSVEQSAILRNNIQITDSLKKAIMLGDDGRYWGNSKRVLMTKEPAVISYNENVSDSSFMRADTILMVPMLDPIKTMSVDSIAQADTISLDEGISQAARIMLQDDIIATDSLITLPIDSLASQNTIKLDSSVTDKIDTLPTIKEEVVLKEQLSEKELKKEAKRKEKELLREQRKVEQSEKRIAKLKAAGLYHDHDHDHELDSLAADSLAADSLSKLAEVSVVPRDIEVVNVADSSDYFIYGIRKVKSYKENMQMLCDSMVINSMDSTATLYIKPIVWNVDNQITADSIILYTRNEQAHKAELFEFPILAQMMMGEKYNQIRGKYMEAFFKNNDVDVLYVDGNSECVYYREEDKEATAMINVSSANMIIYFDSSQISDIKWFNDINFEVYPIEKITEKAKVTVTDFKWLPDERPKSRYDITKRSIRLPQRREMELIARPLFPITIKIDEEKIRFTEQGIWRDRFDLLPVDKEEFKNRSL